MNSEDVGQVGSLLQLGISALPRRFNSHYCSVNCVIAVIKFLPILHTQNGQIAFEMQKSLTFNSDNHTIQMALKKWLTAHGLTKHSHVPKAIKRSMYHVILP